MAQIKRAVCCLLGLWSLVCNVSVLTSVVPIFSPSSGLGGISYAHSLGRTMHSIILATCDAHAFVMDIFVVGHHQASAVPRKNFLCRGMLRHVAACCSMLRHASACTCGYLHFYGSRQTRQTG